MDYNEYSYKKRNLNFVNDLMTHLLSEYFIPERKLDFNYEEFKNNSKKNNFKATEFKVLSIGTGDGAHEDQIDKLSFFNNNELFEINVYRLDPPYNAECENIPFDRDYFDIIFLKSFIEHVKNTDFLLQNCKRVLKLGGKVIILTPDYQKQKDFFYDDYTHVKPFTLKSLEMALLLNDFSIDICQHFWYYRKIWEGRLTPNPLPCRLGLWLTEKTGIKYFRWGADRQLLGVGVKYIDTVFVDGKEFGFKVLINKPKNWPLK